MKLRTLLATLLTCCVMTLYSQTSGEHCVAFKPVIDGSVGVSLTEQQKNALTGKINQILARNNAATTSLYNGFAVTPQINIVMEETISSGIRPVSSMTAELTLSASNIVDFSIYGTVTIEVKASGNTQEQAISSIINAIRPADPRLTKFVSNAVNRISDYYASNMATIIRKTETLMAGSKYDDAMIFLESIPTCVPAYEQSSDAIRELYKTISSKSCVIALSLASRYAAVEDYQSAKSILLSVAAGSDCDAEITAMLNTINANSKGGGDIEIIHAPAAPQPTFEAQPAAPAASSVKLNDPFPSFDMEILSCEGNSSTNVVNITILVKNVTDLEQSFSGARYGTMAYNDSGDEFSISNTTNNSITLRAEMSRKMTVSFNRVSAKNSTINVAFSCRDTKSGKDGVIDIKNLPITW